jgi:3-deoxy-manno-octulosonate cytidylyltransferase (CMP-KDO synthetase)
MNIVAIIPARMDSSRFPGKPLAKIHGFPMIGHVYQRTRKCEKLSAVYVATCDTEIADYLESVDCQVVMTGSQHVRASDRIAEAIELIEEREKNSFDIVVMVQGDEPMVMPQMIEHAIEPLVINGAVQVVNLMTPIQTREEYEDPNTIKVVVGQCSQALYFSREPIPSGSGVEGVFPLWKQVCVIPFRRDYLSTFVKLRPTPLEEAESIDMLRILEHGGQVTMVPSPCKTQSVDTPADLERVVRLMANDPLRSSYQKSQSAG